MTQVDGTSGDLICDPTERVKNESTQITNFNNNRCHYSWKEVQRLGQCES
uniref:Uncharacterized protein n=1 Tax=Arion vulgaris TaxID=1028688 RepID=A0A0B7B936_9EUPU